jgi:CRISPR-associated exonuclease Cas4
MFAEDDLLPLSGLPHMMFCERRWALIQIENVWEENRFTAEGTVLHEKAHSGDIESRPGVLIRRTVALRSFRLGLSGQADIVEFVPAKAPESGVALAGRRGLWRPYPIEYKRSKDKANSQAYRVQLCAQALCLEEMLSVGIREGAVFDGTAKRRQVVPFTDELRDTVEAAAREMHRLFAAGTTPPPLFKKACFSCSLKDRCFPEALGQMSSVQAYYRKFLAEDRD